MSVDAILKGYADAADDQIARAEAIDPAGLLSPVHAFLTPGPARVLDVGAGAGTNAAWLAGRGSSVLAVEPVAALREAGARRSGPAVRWMDDRLPALETVSAMGQRFDRVLLSAVWQHLGAPDRRIAPPSLAGVLADDSLLILSLRHGAGAGSRQVFPWTADETIALGQASGLSLKHREARPSVQAENIANGVNWTWLVLGR